MKLIDKDVLVGEIEKRKIPFKRDIEDGYYPTYLCALMDFEDFINNLEVKKVDLHEEIDNIWKPKFNLGWDDKSLLSVNYEGFKSIAKHFFELGMQVSNKE